MKKYISIVVPVYNEADNVVPLYHAVRTVSNKPGSTYSYELLFVDDGSVDDTVARLKELRATDSHVSVIELSRNFGKEAALSAGLTYAKGDAVILMDGDLQHPPSYIKDFVAAWEKGAEVVIGIRTRNPDGGLFRSISSKLFAHLMRTMSNLPTVTGATDFRLLDRKVVNEFKRFTEHGRMTRGLIDWLGFKRAYITFNAERRNAGTARYSYRQLLGLTFSALVSHSLIPLRLASYLGVFITIFAGGLGFFILVEHFIFNDPLNWQIPATAMLAVMTLFLNGIVLVCLGLMSLYVEKIHREVMNRPLYVVRHINEHNS